MKAKLFVIGWFMLVLSACTSTKVPEPAEGPSLEFCAIDSLMWRHPDSALMRLLPWFDTCCRDAMIASLDTVDSNLRRIQCVSTATAYNRHYANLLLAELLYKNDYAQVNRAELLQAVAYFDSLVVVDGADTRGVSQQTRPRRNARRASAQNIAFLDARAHYINGVGYYENDSMVKACKEYLKALEIMDERFEEKELLGKKAQFMALVYTHLSNLFSDLYLHEQTIYWGFLSLSYYQKFDYPVWHLAWILNEIGSQYDMMKQFDSAICFYQKAINILDDTASLMFRDITSHRICLEYKTGICQADASVKKLRQLLLSSESDRETQARYQSIGEIFYHEQSYDSAWAYLNTVFQTTSVVGLKRQAAEWLVEICKVQGRGKDILEYADYLVPFANKEENQSAKKSELTELYKAFGQAKLKREHQKETRKQFRVALCVFLGLLVVVLIIGLLYQTNKRSKRRLETLIESERQAHKIQQAALSGRLKRSNAALKEHNKAINTTNLSSSSLRQNSSIANYEEEPICQHILALCSDKKNPIKSTVPVAAYADIALNDTQKAQLKDTAMQHYGSLFEKLKQQYPAMKEKDFQYCYLCLLGLDNVQIAVLLQNSISTIWEREKRLKKILGSEDRIAIILRRYMIN